MKDEIKEIINDLQKIADRKCYPEDILDGSIAQEWIDCITNLQNQLEQKETIIKEAREFVNNNSYEYRHDMNLKSKALSITPTRFINMLLQILDKDKNELQGVGKDE